MKAIVFAAGKGVRLEPLTLNRPKHLIPVGGAPLIEHTLRSIKSAGIEDVLMVVHYMKEAIASHLGDGSCLGLSIEYLDQGGIFGTGDALKLGESFVGKGPFLVVYGDLAFHPRVLKEMVSSFKKGSSGMIAGVDLEDVKEYGVVETRGALLKRILEKPQSGGAGTINGGIYVLTPEIFELAAKTPKSSRGEVELTTTINMAIERGGTFDVYHIGSDEWADVGRPWNVLEANKVLLDAYLKESRVDGPLEGNVHLHGNVYVEKGAQLLSGTYIEGPVWISSGCKVGPNSYLRSYTYLCKGVRVGNACEIKGSILMENSHVGHLSYIGDSVIGANCNLGAGTITANLRFDELPVKMSIRDEVVSSGRRKLGAFLGDDVKTGINVSLFPGVKVGSGSWIGPHVPLSEDVPPQTLVTAKIEFRMSQRR
ncbi:MAG: glucose-1-phosphate thymidylyltransferase [Candidatus Verstraetearchaeota archaeon]|nr:glucose-1-phosphate thymidylyltransferase [Candidatus Verstraetearchaeota archaeon]